MTERKAQLTVIDLNGKHVTVKLHHESIRIKHFDGKRTESREVKLEREDFYKICPYLIDDTKLGLGGEYAYDPKILRKIIANTYASRKTGTSLDIDSPPENNNHE